MRFDLPPGTSSPGSPAPGLPERFSLYLYVDVRQPQTTDQAGTADVPQVEQSLPEVDGVLGVAELGSHAGAVVHCEEDRGSQGGGGGGGGCRRGRGRRGRERSLAQRATTRRVVVTGNLVDLT